MRRHLVWLTAICLLWQSLASWAVIETYQFADEELRQRFQILTQELRCPKCQNQNLADSDSQIAADLRAVLYEQLQTGRNDAEIVEFMRMRYGDFVLYRPLVQKNTLVLWFGPLVLIALVSLLLLWSRQGARAVQQLPQPELCADAPLSRQAVNPSKERSHAWFLLLSVLLAVAASVLLYRHLGALQVMQLTELSQRAFSPQTPPEQQLTERASLLSALNAWLETHDAEHSSYASFLYMRSKLWLERADFERAAADYRELLALSPEQDSLQVEFAQILYQLHGETVTPEAENALEQALRLNDRNIIALGMLGLHAYETENYLKAEHLWSRLLPMMPITAPARAELEQAIARARSKAEPAATVTQEATDGLAIALEVQVSLAEALQQLPPATPVFVLLRAHNGPRMPLAVARTVLGALNLPVRLDSSTSPTMAQMDWRQFTQFEVVVRSSRSGSVQGESGDFEVISPVFSITDVPSRLKLHLKDVLP